MGLEKFGRMFMIVTPFFFNTEDIVEIGTIVGKESDFVNVLDTKDLIIERCRLGDLLAPEVNMYLGGSCIKRGSGDVMYETMGFKVYFEDTIVTDLELDGYAIRVALVGHDRCSVMSTYCGLAASKSDNTGTGYYVFNRMEKPMFIHIDSSANYPELCYIYREGEYLFMNYKLYALDKFSNKPSADVTPCTLVYHLISQQFVGYHLFATKHYIREYMPDEDIKTLAKNVLRGY